MFDLHRHDECSTFDGFGKPKELAIIAKELGHTALSVTNHGNTNSLVQTYKACDSVGIKAVLGVEGYFLPKYKEQTRGFHLILIAKDLEGYGNINKIQFEGEKQKYYNPIWDFSILEKYHKGIICTSACLASYSSQCIIKGEIDKAEKYLKKMQSIFGEDFYLEIQPYKVSEKGLQEKVNVELIKLGKKLGIKCILTSDSHRGKKEDFETYMKMHEMANHNFDGIEETYKERYMPAIGEMEKRFYKMHKSDFGEDIAKKLAKRMQKNLEEIEEKIGDKILSGLEETLPVFDENIDSKKLLLSKVKEGLKFRGKYNKQYIDRAKEELNVIFHHKFEDYFLMVTDYVNWAKDNGIIVGPGRGSGCNSIVNWALRITEVDSIYFNLEFRRFLMIERKKMPDIDIDFETARRGEVIEYLLEKYKGHAAQICSYGLYKVDNLVNDLARTCGLPTEKSLDPQERAQNKQIIADIKKMINSYVDEGFMDLDGLSQDRMTAKYNRDYDNIIEHFVKLYEKVKYIGTHAAGVAITGGDILDHTSIRIDTKTGKYFTSYDLNDMEDVNVIKFDMLGLSTMSEIGECRKYAKVKDFDIKMITDKKVIEGFSQGNCDGVFQLDRKQVQDLLLKIHCNCFLDVVAATSMNRPGPLTQKMPDIYAANKEAIESGSGDVEVIDAFDKYLRDTYGTIIYQEQVMQMAVDIAGMTWDEAHKVTKMKKGYAKFNDYFTDDYPKYLANFVKGAKKLGVSKEEAEDVFEKFYNYSFNKGHAVGYSLISAEQMYYKVHFPGIFWFTKMKFSKNEKNYSRFCNKAAKDGSVIFLPHVNYSKPKTSLRKVEGEFVLQQGLSDIKDVGEKAAEVIMLERKNNGVFIDFDDFCDRCKSRAVTSRTIEKLKEQGALEFDKEKYIKKVTLYNSSLYARG